MITHSFYAKALFAKKVISNKGKNTAGIDGIIWKTDYQKKQAIEQLNPNHYSPKAVKGFYNRNLIHSSIDYFTSQESEELLKEKVV